MFGAARGIEDTVFGESYDRYHQASPASPTRGEESATQSRLASSSQILGNKRQVPWWLRENRRRLGDLAEASASQSIGMQAQTETKVSTPPSLRSAIAPSTSDSPATHTMFLPSYATPTSQGRSSTSPSSTVKTFVQNVYNVGKDIIAHGGTQREGPIHLQTHLSKKDKALWNWVNVDDLDEFLQEVYTFYVRKGIWSIALAGFLDLL